MSLIDFIRDAGENLFKHTPAAAASSHPTTTSAAPNQAALNGAAADAIGKYIASKGLPADKLTLAFDGANRTVRVSGTVPDQVTREKIVLCCGNVSSVEHVDDHMSVSNAGAASDYYTVKSGDTLSSIAKKFYDAANKYPAIFEANKPMLSDPDKIYPGQVLRIPKQA
ncbi:MAG: peptidoglycan-binding protein LysM [Lysobacteraceae bacterium]